VRLKSIAVRRISLGHENNIKCEHCKQKVAKKSETRTTISFECPCGKRSIAAAKDYNMGKSEQEQRALRAIDITQKKLDKAIHDEESSTKILVTREAVNIGVQHFKDHFGRTPVRNTRTGGWE
jgi:hypothetical protein